MSKYTEQSDYLSLAANWLCPYGDRYSHVSVYLLANGVDDIECSSQADHTWSTDFKEAFQNRL